jgi:drug/metabolite transporter (DMT)-like permease
MSADADARRARWLVVVSLFLVYVVWGSTYFAMRVALDAFPPFLMCGSRFVSAGGLLFLALRLRGDAAPTARQWGASAIVGFLLLMCGNGLVAIAERTIDSGVAATVVATVPLWAAGIAAAWGERASRTELLGLLLGFGGVVVLRRGGSLGVSGHQIDALAILVAPISWALGSVWSRHLPLPEGLMATAAQMLTGGAILLTASLLRGEGLPSHVTVTAVSAVSYLVVFGSIIAFSAYGHLLRNTSPAVATSYAYANPIVALMIGAVWNHEGFTTTKALACVLTLLGVAMVLVGKARTHGAVAGSSTAVK